MADAGDVRRSVADRASSYSRVVDEGKVILSGSVSFGCFICAMVVQLHMVGKTTKISAMVGVTWMFNFTYVATMGDGYHGYPRNCPA